MMSKEISINPVTRLEGEAKITIFLDDSGNVEDAYFQTVEFKGFERFCVGRPVEELARITPRICGVCPGAHVMASTKAIDAVFNTKPTETARKIRELFYDAFTVHDHLLHFYVLAAPDFVMGPDAPRASRNVLGMIDKVGEDLVKKVLRNMKNMTEIQETIGGKAIHSVFGLPGGVSRGISEEERADMEKKMSETLEFIKDSLSLLKEKIVPTYKDIIVSEGYIHRTYYMGTVDENNMVNLYDGKLRVVDPDGNEFAKFHPSEYQEHIAEHVEPWTFIKFPYLKNVGWNGIKDGKDSGVYRVGPLARMNVAEGFTTPLANEEFKEFYEFFGGSPVHHTMAYHWARLIETLYAAEHGLQLLKDRSITGKDIRAPVGRPGEGVGCVEAPRGTLIHHYFANSEGITEKVNIIVATTHNNGGICMSVKKAAQSVIKNGEINDGILNLIEMAFRAYDPCLACATHTLPGNMPMEVEIMDHKGRKIKELRRGESHPGSR